MLRELHIRNLAVVEEASLELTTGLHVLTGETGAGKSIVVDSLGLLAGARAVNDLIRTGADTLSVAGVFTPAGDDWRAALAAAGHSDDGDEILIRREISRGGRNRIFVNDQPATLKLLAELAPHLLRIHGQRDELGLVDPERQREWLDRSAGAAAEALKGRVAEAYFAWHRLTGGLDRLTDDETSRQERLDLLSFQAAEIEAARLQAGEAAELRREREVLRHAEAIQQALAESYELLFDGEGAAVDRVAKSESRLAAIAEWEPAAEGWRQELAEARVRLEEAAADQRRRLDALEADPARLDFVEERLASIERLLRKHRVETCAELVALGEAMRREIGEIEAAEESRAELAARAAEALETYRRAAAELSAGRREWRRRLVSGIEAELVGLGLEKAHLGIELTCRPLAGSPLEVDGEEVEFGPAGYDQVVFQFAPNPGEEARPLAAIASGGELSRIYLALQLAARSDDGPTLVFDEVDTGIGGAQAAGLGRKLRRLGTRSQVLVVTHLPQVASFGHHHFRIHKAVDGGRTRTRVEALGEEARVEELARMLGGEATTDLTRSHARELIGQGTAEHPVGSAP